MTINFFNESFRRVFLFLSWHTSEMFVCRFDEMIWPLTSVFLTKMFVGEIKCLWLLV